MNVLYITEQDISRPGGARSHVLGFCTALENLGINVELISPFGPRMTGQKRSGGRRVRHLLRLKKMVDDIERSIGECSPDLIFYRKGFFDPGFWRVVKRAKCPVVLEVNGAIGYESNNLVEKAFFKFLVQRDKNKLRAATYVVAVTLGLRDQLVDDVGIPQDRVIVIENGVDTNLYRPRDKAQCRRDLDLPADKVLCVFVGKIAKWHGLDVAVEAIDRLPTSEREGFQLVVVGDGPVRQEIQAKVERLKLGNCIFFRGAVDQEAASMFMGAADFCIAPFIAERNDEIGISPLKIFEYLACGRRVICSDVKGIRSLLKPLGLAKDSVHLVAPDDVAGLQSALSDAINARETAPLEIDQIVGNISWTSRVRDLLRAI